jgi:hypothetical protein
VATTDGDLGSLRPSEAMIMPTPLPMYQINCHHYGGYIDAIGGDRSKIKNPYVIGHLINHPPANTFPNVFPVPFLWRDIQHHQRQHLSQSSSSSSSSSSYRGSVAASLTDDFDQYRKQINTIGNGIWYIDPQNLQPIYLSEDYTSPCCGLALISLRTIQEEEELYLDYQFEPKYRPVWYTPVQYSN